MSFTLNSTIGDCFGNLGEILVGSDGNHSTAILDIPEKLFYLD